MIVSMREEKNHCSNKWSIKSLSRQNKINGPIDYFRVVICSKVRVREESVLSNNL